VVATNRQSTTSNTSLDGLRVRNLLRAQPRHRLVRHDSEVVWDALWVASR
jgi:hypothetical protein